MATEVPLTKILTALGGKESFGGLGNFRKEWESLSEKDREDIRKGVADGTLNY